MDPNLKDGNACRAMPGHSSTRDSLRSPVTRSTRKLNTIPLLSSNTSDRDRTHQRRSRVTRRGTDTHGRGIPPQSVMGRSRAQATTNPRNSATQDRKGVRGSLTSAALFAPSHGHLYEQDVATALLLCCHGMEKTLISGAFSGGDGGIGTHRTDPRCNQLGRFPLISRGSRSQPDQLGSVRFS